MSSKKQKSINATIIDVDGRQIAVSKPVGRIFYRYHNVVYSDKIVAFFLSIGVLGYLAAYIYYSFENHKLINQPSFTNPTFFCPNNNNNDPCGGKAYYIDPATRKKVCTV